MAYARENIKFYYYVKLLTRPPLRRRSDRASANPVSFLTSPLKGKGKGGGGGGVNQMSIQ
jgi:hypothetical protein